MAEWFGVVGRAQSGATVRNELVGSKDRAAEIAEELLESDHSVEIFRCTPIKFEIVTKTTLLIMS